MVSTACAPTATRVLISARCKFIISALAKGSTKAAAAPRAGQIAPNR